MTGGDLDTMLGASLKIFRIGFGDGTNEESGDGYGHGFGGGFRCGGDGGQGYGSGPSFNGVGNGGTDTATENAAPPNTWIHSMNSSDRDDLLDSSLKIAGIDFGHGCGSGGSSSGFGGGSGTDDGGGDFWGGGGSRGGAASNDGEERYEIDIPNEHDDNEKGTP